MVKETDISREVIGDQFMGVDNNSDFWYCGDDGIWKMIGQLSDVSSISVDLSDEDIAKLSRILVPLGELEIVPRDKE